MKGAKGQGAKIGRRGDLGAVEFALIEEGENVVDGLVLHEDHVFGQGFEETQETSFGIVPGVGLQLLVDRLETLDDARDAEFEVALGAVQSADNKIDDAQVHIVAV